MTTLALLALLPNTLVPVSEQILEGTKNSGGNLASWAADDNDARTICKFFVTMPPGFPGSISSLTLERLKPPQALNFQ